MENKEKHDIFNLVADTIIKWYDQTHTTMTIAIKPASHLDVELMGVLRVARKQTLGVLTTLVNKHILSTHALLRVLLETHIVLVWALRDLANDKKPTSDEVHKRLRRWDLTRLRKDKELLEDLPQTPKIESAIGKAKSDIKKLQKEGIKGLPNYKQLFQDLGGEEPDRVKKWEVAYAKFYRKYSRAVHLNRNVTQQLAWIKNEEPKAILYKDDIEPDGDELLIMASISCDINKVVRSFYGWESAVIQNEYKQIDSELTRGIN